MVINPVNFIFNSIGQVRDDNSAEEIRYANLQQQSLWLSATRSRRKVRYEEFIDLVYAHVGAERASILDENYWGQVPVEVEKISHGQPKDLGTVDILGNFRGSVQTHDDVIRVNELQVNEGNSESLSNVEYASKHNVKSIQLLDVGGETGNDGMARFEDDVNSDIWSESVNKIRIGMQFESKLQLKLTHICFATDILLFCNGDSNSVSILKKALDEFGNASGLIPSAAKSRNFWDVPEKEGSSWGRKNILRHRWTFRNHFVHRVGDGKSISVWFDNRHAICPLSDFISKRKIASSCLSLDCKLSAIIDLGFWKWPSEIADSFDGLVAISPPLLIEGKNDKVLWRLNNCRYEFFVSNVWKDIRRRNELVWSRLKFMVKLDHAPNSWQALIDFMISKRVSKSIWSILQRLLIGATVYIIWQERNLRIFQGKSRSVDELCSQIRDVIRLRVMSLKLNASFQGFEAANIWEFNVKQINGRGKL
ncbi:hypothetical protein Tco_0805498 [Tanacetum coccineum]